MSTTDLLKRDISRADSTNQQDVPAFALFNHFLVNILGMCPLDDISDEDLDYDAENILTGYSLFLRNTNIPVNHQKCLADPTITVTSYLKYSSLTEYLGKIIVLLKKKLPENDFLKDKAAVDDISGIKFQKACKRKQQQKDDTFGHESKIGLYREARHGSKIGFAPHWTALTNCDEICKNMMMHTKGGDTYNNLTAKRAALVITKHAVGRGGESKHLNITNFQYNPHLDCLDPTWTEQKTLSLYSCPLVPNKYGWPTDVYHALGCYFACGNGLYRETGVKNRNNLIPRVASMAGSGVSRWLTSAIRDYMPKEVPEEAKKAYSSVSLRIAGVTEMGAGNVGFFPSHARSGHKIQSNQDKYFDRDDIESSMTAAMCLAGWTDYTASVSLPNLRCLNVPDETIIRLVDELVMNSFDDFKPTGRLWPILCACVASMIMYDRDVIADLKSLGHPDPVNNAPSLALRRAFEKARIIDTRSGSEDTVATLQHWGTIIGDNFRASNPDFHPLTNKSNSTQVINSINNIGESYTALRRENAELKSEVRHVSTVAEGLRVHNNELLTAVQGLQQTVKYMLDQVKKIARWEHVPETPVKRNAAQLSRTRTPPPAAAEKRQRCNSSPADAVEDANLMNQKLPPPTPVVEAATNSEEPPPTTRITVTSLRSNYNNVDTGDTHGGTDIQDIITSATFNGPEVTFKGLKRLERFKDNAKFNHCCSLFAAVATPEQKALLLTLLSRIELRKLADEIADACMLQLTKWEGKETGAKKGYAGVGARVQKIKAWNKSLDLDATAPIPENEVQVQDNDDDETELAAAGAPSLEAVSAAITVNVDNEKMQQKKLADFPKKPRPDTHRLHPSTDNTTVKTTVQTKLGAFPKKPRPDTIRLEPKK